MGCAPGEVGGRRAYRGSFDHRGFLFFDAAGMRPASGVLLRFGGKCTVRFVGITSRRGGLGKHLAICGECAVKDGECAVKDSDRAVIVR
jgi:hypothetical protein